MSELVTAEIFVHFRTFEDYSEPTGTKALLINPSTH